MNKTFGLRMCCRLTPTWVAILGVTSISSLAQEPSPAPAQAAATSPASGVPSDPVITAASKLVREGKADEALEQIRKAAAAHPEWPSPVLILARMHFATGRSDRGRIILEDAAVESPDDPSVALTFAAIDLAEGRRHDAKLNADHALALAPKIKDASQIPAVTRDAHKILATIAEARGDWAGAREHLTAALAVEPKDGSTRQSLGRVLFKIGDLDGASRELTTAHQDLPTLDPPDLALAQMHARTGDPAKATEWFAKALKNQPKAARPRIAYALWLMDQGKLAEAKPLADEAADLEPDAKEPRKLRGLIAFHMRDLPVAEAIYESLLKDTPNDPGSANFLALCLVDQQDRAKRLRGLQLAENLARQLPRSPEILATLGHAHDRNGHPQDAEINLRAAVATGRAAPDTAYFLARVLADRGNPDEARKLLVAATAQAGMFAYRKEANDLLKTLPSGPR